MQETAIIKAEVRTITPIVDHINTTLLGGLKLDIPGVAKSLEDVLRGGITTDALALSAEAIATVGRNAVKIANEIRKAYTKITDDWKKATMAEVAREIEPIITPLEKIENQLIERADEIDRQRREAEAKAAEEQRLAEEKATKEEERRRNISLAQGGEGNFTPVEREVTPQTAHISTRVAPKSKTIVDPIKIQQAVDKGVREIAGVNIFRIWTFEVTNHKEVPHEYRKRTR